MVTASLGIVLWPAQLEMVYAVVTTLITCSTEVDNLATATMHVRAWDKGLECEIPPVSSCSLVTT